MDDELSLRERAVIANLGKGDLSFEFQHRLADDAEMPLKANGVRRSGARAGAQQSVGFFGIQDIPLRRS